MEAYMAIRIRGGVTRRGLLATAASATAHFGHRIDRQALSQPRRRPAARHPWRAIGRRVARTRRDLGARRPVRRACWSSSRPRDSFQEHAHGVFVDALPESDFTAKALDRGTARRAGHLLSRPLPGPAHRPRSSGEPMVGRFRTAPADRRSISFVWSGDYRRTGLGHRRGARRHAHLRHHAAQPAGLLHPQWRQRSMRMAPIARRAKAAERRDLEKHRHRGEVEGRGDARRVSRQLQIQSSRQERAAPSTPKSRSSASGTTTRSPTTGGRASRSRAPSISARNTSRRTRCCSRRARSRAFHGIHADARLDRSSRAASTARISYGPLLDIFDARHAQLPRPQRRGQRGDATARTPTSWARASRLAQARTARFTRHLEGDRRRHADRADRAIRRRPQMGRRGDRPGRRPAAAAASSRSPTCLSFIKHAGVRNTALAHRRRALHRRSLL